MVPMASTVVTVTGGAGNPSVSLTYTTGSLALLQAQAIAASIDNTYTTATYDTSKQTVAGGTGYMILGDKAFRSGTVDAVGFSAVVDVDDVKKVTVDGGGSQGQVFLASGAGLTYDAATGNVTVVAGGGKNDITFGTGNDIYYSDGTNNTVNAGAGADTIYAGAGTNKIYGGSGADTVVSTGIDKIYLGTGTTSVNDTGFGADTVYGASSVAGSGYNLVFQGGAEFALVEAGAGSYSIVGGSGGGVFHGGTAGDNYIHATAGDDSIYGGGAGDTLVAGAGYNFIQAGLGNETLEGANGNTDFNFIKGMSGGDNTTVTITDFNGTNDFLTLEKGFTSAYALAHATVSDGNTYINLEDGTKIELVGFTHLTASNFH
jgi:Ca2+-binding RTX toxin-like protein